MWKVKFNFISPPLLVAEEVIVDDDALAYLYDMEDKLGIEILSAFDLTEHVIGVDDIKKRIARLRAEIGG